MNFRLSACCVGEATPGAADPVGLNAPDGMKKCLGKALPAAAVAAGWAWAVEKSANRQAPSSEGHHVPFEYFMQ